MNRIWIEYVSKMRRRQGGCKTVLRLSCCHKVFLAERTHTIEISVSLPSVLCQWKSKIIVNNWKKSHWITGFFRTFAKTILIVEMRLCNTIPARLLAKDEYKQCNTLNTNNLGGGIAQQIIHLKYLFTTFSDARQGHLSDLSCPCQTRPSGMLSEQSPLRLG